MIPHTDAGHLLHTDSDSVRAIVTLEGFVGQHVHIQDDVIDFQGFGNLFSTAKFSDINGNLVGFRKAKFFALDVESVPIQFGGKGFGVFKGVCGILLAEFHELISANGHLGQGVQVVVAGRTRKSAPVDSAPLVFFHVA